MKTLNELYKETVETLKGAGIKTPKTDTELLLTHFLKIEKINLYTDYDVEISSEKIYEFNKLIKRRVNREPIAYIICQKDFYGLTFLVSKNVLVPRRETEILVETVLNKRFQNRSVLDIGTGTGNIAITLKKFNSTLEVTATDISLKAIDIAKKNALKIIPQYDIEFVHSNLFENISGTYDIIVSNPPYIPTDEITNLMPEVSKYEPLIALDGGKDGLDFYRQIINDAVHHLKSGGYIFLEISPQIKDGVVTLLSANNFKDIDIIKDYSNNDRVVSGVRS